MKRSKIMLATMALAVITIGMLSFTNKSYHKKAFTVRCFTFTDPTTDGIDPTDAEVTDATNYAETSSDAAPDCEGTLQILCGICFNDTDFPLTVAGKPNFAGIAPLSDLVIAHKTTVGGANFKQFCTSETTPRCVDFYYKPRPAH